MSEPTINASTSLQILRQTYTEKVLKTVIPRNTDLRDAHFQKQDIFSFAPHAKAALAYDKLIREIFLPRSDVTESIDGGPGVIAGKFTVVEVAKNLVFSHTQSKRVTAEKTSWSYLHFSGGFWPVTPKHQRCGSSIYKMCSATS